MKSVVIASINIFLFASAIVIAQVPPYKADTSIKGTGYTVELISRQDRLIHKLTYFESQRRISEKEARKMRIMLDEHQEKGIDLGIDYDSLSAINNYHVLRSCHLRDSIMSTVSLIYDSTDYKLYREQSRKNKY